MVVSVGGSIIGVGALLSPVVVGLPGIPGPFQLRGRVGIEPPEVWIPV
jgi:hypothetical protein